MKREYYELMAVLFVIVASFWCYDRIVEIKNNIFDGGTSVTIGDDSVKGFTVDSARLVTQYDIADLDTAKECVFSVKAAGPPRAGFIEINGLWFELHDRDSIGKITIEGDTTKIIRQLITKLWRE